MEPPRAATAAGSSAAAVDESQDPLLSIALGMQQAKRRIAVSGMGAVYEAEQESPKRLVAIKVVRGGQGADEYRIRLFQREAHRRSAARPLNPSAGPLSAGHAAGRQIDELSVQLVRRDIGDGFSSAGSWIKCCLPANDREVSTVWG